jgi:hypothetical protein
VVPGLVGHDHRHLGAALRAARQGDPDAEHVVARRAGALERGVEGVHDAVDDVVGLAVVLVLGDLGGGELVQRCVEDDRPDVGLRDVDADEAAAVAVEAQACGRPPDAARGQPGLGDDAAEEQVAHHGGDGRRAQPGDPRELVAARLAGRQERMHDFET